MATIFCALSRDNSALKRELELCLVSEGNHRFDCLHGEFCAFLAEPSNGRMAFGRDVFGRKSLCWRLLPPAIGDSSAGSRFELSVLPGRAKENDAEWRELPPGCIVLLTLPNSTKFETNSKLPCNPLPELSCLLPSGHSFDKVVVHTYYPREQFADDPFYPFFKQFSQMKFMTAMGAERILPPPSFILPNPWDIISSPFDAPQLAPLTSEFVCRFTAALQGILLSVPCISELAGPDWSGIRVPVLFSGGVDSLMVALIAGEVIMQKAQGREKEFAGRVRLFSVAFGDQKQEFSRGIDRQQSIAAYEHLKSRYLEKYGVNPFALVLINVTKQELIECRTRHIAEAVAPSKTVLDDSLGCVVWFATRMQGIDFETGQVIMDPTPYVLVGSGSDEQLGGYARHRTVFESEGLAGLTAELSMEMHRIGARNFGRDDRVGTSNGKAILAPFLEEELVCWLNTVPTMLKTGYGLAPIGTNKLLLRNALRSLGMSEQFFLRPKRAMQFGTRMVKMEMGEGKGKRPKGDQICERLLLHDNQ